MKEMAGIENIQESAEQAVISKGSSQIERESGLESPRGTAIIGALVHEATKNAGFSEQQTNVLTALTLAHMRMSRKFPPEGKNIWENYPTSEVATTLSIDQHNLLGGRITPNELGGLRNRINSVQQRMSRPKMLSPEDLVALPAAERHSMYGRTRGMN
jgi:hypothetical protein